MRVSDVKDIQKPVCFEMEYFIDYSFDFASEQRVCAFVFIFMPDNS